MSKANNMNVPEQITRMANSYGFNTVKLVKQTKEESVYSIQIVDADGFSLPTGLPHYIVDRNGNLSLVCDTDFHITSSL